MITRYASGATRPRQRRLRAHRCVPLDSSTTLVRRVLVDSSARMLRAPSMRRLSTSNRMDITCAGRPESARLPLTLQRTGSGEYAPRRKPKAGRHLQKGAGHTGARLGLGRQHGLALQPVLVVFPAQVQLVPAPARSQLTIAGRCLSFRNGGVSSPVPCGEQQETTRRAAGSRTHARSLFLGRARGPALAAAAGRPAAGSCSLAGAPAPAAGDPPPCPRTQAASQACRHRPQCQCSAGRSRQPSGAS